MTIIQYIGVFIFSCARSLCHTTDLGFQFNLNSALASLHAIHFISQIGSLVHFLSGHWKSGSHVLANQLKAVSWVSGLSHLHQTKGSPSLLDTSGKMVNYMYHFVCHNIRQGPILSCCLVLCSSPTNLSLLRASSHGHSSRPGDTPAGILASQLSAQNWLSRKYCALIRTYIFWFLVIKPKYVIVLWVD